LPIELKEPALNLAGQLLVGYSIEIVMRRVGRRCYSFAVAEPNGFTRKRPRQGRHLDLGLLVSNDGIHFREPIPDFAFLKAGTDGEWDQRGLVHGQGYWNDGDKTYIYYGAWDPSHDNDGGGAIGLATMRRDGFGFLSARDAEDGLLTTAPVANTRPKGSLYINAEGLSQDARLVVELIDKLGTPIHGYSGADAAAVQQSGLRVRVAWPGRDVMNFPNPQFRVRIRFTGRAATRARFYAAYVLSRNNNGAVP
jgi:hypothetical protein